jgi:hypothetical protein
LEWEQFDVGIRVRTEDDLWHHRLGRMKRHENLPATRIWTKKTSAFGT